MMPGRLGLFKFELGACAGDTAERQRNSGTETHIDDILVIEEQTHKPLTIVIRLKSVKPISEYNFYPVRKDRLVQNRDRFGRALAALIEASNYMYDPKNLDRVAEIATIAGRTKAQAKSALEKFFAIEFWPRGNDGLGSKERRGRN